MILGVIIGLAGLVAVVITYLNRDELKGPPRGRELTRYVLAVLVSISVGIAIIAITTSQQDVCGGPDSGPSRCA